MVGMKLQTKVDIETPPFLVDYKSRLMLLGSCFAGNMGEKLQYFKFRADVNPCGIVYNPCSVANVLKLLLSGRQFTSDDLLQNDRKWVSLYHHGSFSSESQDDCLHNINERLAESAENLKNTDILMLTFGTAWVYRFKQTGEIVSNCHRFPSGVFDRFRLTVGDIVKEYTELIGDLRKQNPALQIIFTVSPIRHWKDGANGNQLSKATLLLAIDEICRCLKNVYYFPSYEIVMDELRDYRFYAEDMLHVSDLTVNYIWECFKDICLAPDTRFLMERIEKVNKALAHRPSDEKNPAWQDLIIRTHKEAQEIDNILKKLSGC